MNGGDSTRGPRLRSSRRRLLAAALAIPAAAALLSTVARRGRPSTQAAASRTMASPTILRRGNGPEPESLDPHRARSESALTLLRDLFEGLASLDANGAPVPAAAERWEVSPDGKTLRFVLRSGARWSNGAAVAADDFVAAWQRLVDPRTGAQYADILGMVRGAVAVMAGTAPPADLDVRAEGARILVVELERPTPYFLSVMAHPATFPLYRGSAAAHARDRFKPGFLVSNGAFVLTRWDFGSHLVAARNRMYWNDVATRLDGVEYYSFPDGATELRAFRTGQVDVTSTIPAAQSAWIRGHLGASLRVAPQLAVYFLGFNLRRPPFGTSRELRQALSLAIDRQRLVESVTGCGEAPAYTFVPPQTRGYAPPVPDDVAWPMPKRIERARQLLRDAGMERAPPAVELRYNSGEPHNRIAVAVAAMWKAALGIETTLRAEEFKVLLQDIDRGDVSVFRGSWLGDYNDAYGFLQVLKSGFGINLPHYANGTYDGLLERAADEGDAARRSVLLQSAESLMLVDQPLIPLYFYVSKHLVADRVRGWSNNVMNVVYSKDLGKAGAAAGG